MKTSARTERFLDLELDEAATVPGDITAIHDYSALGKRPSQQERQTDAKVDSVTSPKSLFTMHNKSKHLLHSVEAIVFTKSD